MDEQQSIDDPYKGFAKLFKRIAAESGRQPSAIIGKIVSPPPELKVSVNGMVLDKKYFWVDEYWVQGHTRTHEGHIVSETQPKAGGGGYAEFASHTHAIDNDYTDREILTDTWKAGDHVFLIPILGDDKKTAEQFFIWGKAVRLDGNYG